MDIIRDMKKKVLETTLVSYDEGLFAGTSGNLSMCDPMRELVAITPSNIRYESMSEEDIMIIKMDGTVLEGAHRPSSEWRMHPAILPQRKEIGAVVHTHSPYATSFAVVGTPVPLILIEMLGFLGGDIPVADFELPGSLELGLSALNVLKNRTSCLLSNHGVLTIGSTIEQAHLRAVYVEDAAKIYSLALQAGSVRLVPEEAARKMRARLGISE